jgi:predicted Zn finger-like uncharacterized protein
LIDFIARCDFCSILSSLFNKAEKTPMIIFTECDSCRTRFRLDIKAFKGFKAMRARCRKCGAFIEIRNPVLVHAMPGREDRQSNPDAGPVNAPAREEAIACEKPILPPVAGMEPACRENGAQPANRLFDQKNSWREEGIGSLSSLPHPTPQHPKTKSRSHRYDYVRISNYVLVYAVLLFAGCSAYLLFRIFISYLN